MLVRKLVNAASKDAFIVAQRGASLGISISLIQY